MQRFIIFYLLVVNNTDNQNEVHRKYTKTATVQRFNCLKLAYGSKLAKSFASRSHNLYFATAKMELFINAAMELSKNSAH